MARWRTGQSMGYGACHSNMLCKPQLQAHIEYAGAEIMESLAEWLNPTRIVGMSAYLFAAASCGIAWVRSRNIPGSRRLIAILGALEAGLILDMALNGRWLLHDLLEGKAMANNLYAQRVWPQLLALGLLSAVAAAGMWSALLFLHGRAGASVAVCGAILSLSCWCAEVISLHAIDVVFHRMVDGAMLVSLIWIASSLMTGLGIL